MATLNQVQLQAANEFAEAAIVATADAEDVHAETAVVALARMAGTFLFRSFAFPVANLKPGQAVFSDQANDEGPRLVELLGGTLLALDVVVDQARVTGKPKPGRLPPRTFLETQRLLEPRLTAIREQRKLDLKEAAEAAAAGTALLIRHGSRSWILTSRSTSPSSDSSKGPRPRPIP